MLKRFFILCAGADEKILSECSHGEQNKYVGIGATVFFTAVMAFIAAAYALYTVFDTYLTAIFFGLIWGLLIFNLDRFIVSTIKKKDRFIREFLQAVPRLILAVIIAIVISKPLELKIFEKEIDRVLLEQKNDYTLSNKEQIQTQYTPQVEALNEEIKALTTTVETKEAAVNALYDTYIAEAEGRKGTKKIGKGPVYKEKREKHDAALAALKELKTTTAARIKTLEEKKEALAVEYQEVVAASQPVIDNFDGLMARIEALGKLPWFPSFFIFLLFLAIETAPIFAKLISARGEYDYRIEDREQEVKSWVDQKKNQRTVLVATDHTINDKVYQDIAEEEELYAYKKKITRDLMKKQQDAFYKKQTGIL
ncbi:DUF4407 domain-containing protein [Aquimarina sp. TRL1]|uniref:DUF4407 domain-containing protein n=1 Tax=Aquimarina sp. (strain TRL1) TaxID=2736252 RepID=UPI00158D9015|nr:DUF4407 domain-containing protein [Aquimarina sp. TRL1]QKX04336.1 DUF4407 domain-containing protein [Aquimarina sp. TRL1]